MKFSPKSSKSEEDMPVDEVMDDTEVSITYDIASYPSDLTLSVIAEMWKNNDILIPEFQRNFVWNIKQSSLLIESFLLGLPVPQVFFYIDENNKNLVIDGQQRILSIVSFIDGHFGVESLHGKQTVFRLLGLNEQSQFYRKRFDDLNEAWQRKLKSAVLRAINIRQLSPKGENTAIYHIFERLNTGGTPLRPQEIRNCVFRGEIVTLLKTLNQDANWRTIIGKKTFDIHQKDLELILRIFALSRHWHNYEKPMKEFLNTAMEQNKSATSTRVKRFKDNFSAAAEIIAAKLGAKPFHVRGPLNTSVLDAVFCTVLDNLSKIPLNFKNRYLDLLANNEFEQATYYSTSDASVLSVRFNKAQQILIGS